MNREEMKEFIREVIREELKVQVNYDGFSENIRVTLTLNGEEIYSDYDIIYRD